MLQLCYKFKLGVDILCHINYTIVVAQKVGELLLSPKTGRPKAKNPKTIEVKARIDEATNNLLSEYCKKNNTTRTEVVRKGIGLVIKQK